jgi:hypothetical protein
MVPPSLLVSFGELNLIRQLLATARRDSGCLARGHLLPTRTVFVKRSAVAPWYIV